VGPAREAGPRRKRRRRGAGRVWVGLGREVRDDTRAPRVSLCGRRQAAVGRQAKVGRAREVGLGVRERGVESGGRERTSQELGRDANGLGRRPGRVVSFSFLFFLFLFPLKASKHI
jgi:hypothetical protein